MNDSDGIRKGRPYGGLAVLWKKQLGISCDVNSLDPRLLLMDITIGDKRISLLNVYLPYDDSYNIGDFQLYLARVGAHLDGSYSYSAALGDFNANISSSHHRFGRELVKFCDNESLVISDALLGSKDTFTFLVRLMTLLRG